MSSGPNFLRRIWYRWKSLQLPWRRQFLVGADLAGNTFWVFKDHLNANRWRRIAKYGRNVHHADVAISPQWHQWLRHTREAAPSIEEQQSDVSRRAMMKELAAKADERWRSVPSFLDSPNRQQPRPAIGVDDTRTHTPPPAESSDRQPVARRVVENQGREGQASDGQGQKEGPPVRSTRKAEKEPNPWQRAQRGAPSENWQPEAWTPDVARRR